MIPRIVTLMLIAVLALPVATLSRPGETNQSPWTSTGVMAKAKKHKGHHHHKKHKKQTRRTTITRTFTSTQLITIPNGAATNDKGPADPYPSTIAVSGFRNGKITDVNLIITDLTHAHHDDLDIMLSSSDGRRALVMSDVGDISDIVDIDLVLDDEGDADMPGGQNSELSSGTYRPTNIDRFDDIFDTPAPTLNGDVALSTFDGANPNGTWQLWVMDNGGGDHGGIESWSLQITAEVDG
jgi:subtilisin-like proprotein convertase family protein